VLLLLSLGHVLSVTEIVDEVVGEAEAKRPSDPGASLRRLAAKKGEAEIADKTPERASTAQIVGDYRSQEAAEGDFRQMKDPKVVSFSPMFHFTEQKIRVHVFYCVLALMVSLLMVGGHELAGCSLRWTPPSAASTTSSTSGSTVRSVELGNTRAES
jgi:hypothetical protein